jgi:hypothetical protein
VNVLNDLNSVSDVLNQVLYQLDHFLIPDFLNDNVYKESVRIVNIMIMVFFVW